MNQISTPSSNIIQLDIDLTIENEEPLLDEFIAFSQEMAGEVTIDLSQVKSIDAHGLAILAMFQKTLSSNDSQLKLLTQNSDFMTLFESVGLTHSAIV